MPSLKELQVRINSVKSTRKITSAMKMVAASRLKKAQDAVNSAKDYNWHLKQMYAVIIKEVNKRIDRGETIKIPVLISGNNAESDGKNRPKRHVVIVHSSDRGLCGGFNASIAKFTREYVRRLQGEGKDVRIICIGKKAKDILKWEFSELFMDPPDDEYRLDRASDALGVQLMNQYVDGDIDEASVVYNKFVSAMTQVPKAEQVLPVSEDKLPNEVENKIKPSYLYDFEPDLETVLLHTTFSLLRNRLYRAGVESLASEQGARMTSMDASTRNAGEIINRLTLTYNRRRQAAITTELVEIIAGAEAV